MSRLSFALIAATALAIIWAPYLARAQTAAAADPGPSPICTDRPSKSSATCTVDPGMIQIEADVVNASFQRLNGTTTDTYLIANPTVKYGLTKTLDIEAGLDPYEVVRTRDQTGTRTESGIGDLYLRLKSQFYKSADSATQISLFPYIKLPTARHGIGNGSVEGGLIVPITYQLNDKINLAYSPEGDVFKDTLGSGRHFNTAHAVSIAYSLPGDYTLNGEVWGDWNFDPTGTVKQYSLDFIVTKLVNKGLQLDGGVNFGLNRETPGVQVYAGVSTKY